MGAVIEMPACWAGQTPPRAPRETFAMIIAGLRDLPLDLDRGRDRCIYLAYLAARRGMGETGLDRRIEELQQDITQRPEDQPPGTYTRALVAKFAGGKGA